MTTTETATLTTGAPAADASRYPKPYRDPAMTCEVVHSSYQHLFGGYLALARHFEEAKDAVNGPLYREKFQSTLRFELDLWKLNDDEKWKHETEILPLLIKEMHALRKQHLGY